VSETEAIKILWSCGLSPDHHPDIVAAAKGAKSIIDCLRAVQDDPDHNLQSVVLRKLANSAPGWAERLPEWVDHKEEADEPRG
jgi:hypothetical protein